MALISAVLHSSLCYATSTWHLHRDRRPQEAEAIKGKEFTVVFRRHLTAQRTLLTAHLSMPFLLPLYILDVSSLILMNPSSFFKFQIKGIVVVGLFSYSDRIICSFLLYTQTSVELPAVGLITVYQSFKCQFQSISCEALKGEPGLFLSEDVSLAPNLVTDRWPAGTKWSFSDRVVKRSQRRNYSTGHISISVVWYIFQRKGF